MATVQVRYIVTSVDDALKFYTQHLGFTEVMHPAPQFAMLTRGDLRLVLSEASGAQNTGGGASLADGTRPVPGGCAPAATRAAGIRYGRVEPRGRAWNAPASPCRRSRRAGRGGTIRCCGRPTQAPHR